MEYIPYSIITDVIIVALYYLIFFRLIVLSFVESNCILSCVMNNDLYYFFGIINEIFH